MTGPSVTRTVRATYVGQRPTPIPVAFIWTAEDPWAVTLDFTRDGVTWRIGGELLFDALATGRAGDGDVRFYTVAGQPAALLLELRGFTKDREASEAVLYVPRAPLVEFLGAVVARQSDMFLREMTS